MNKMQAQEILDLFRSKAPHEDYIMNHSPIESNSIELSGMSLFDGVENDKKKVASITTHGLEEDDIYNITLYTANYEEFRINDSVELLKYLINKFCVIPPKKKFTINI